MASQEGLLDVQEKDMPAKQCQNELVLGTNLISNSTCLAFAQSLSSRENGAILTGTLKMLTLKILFFL